jgi:hypothetical protein
VTANGDNRVGEPRDAARKRERWPSSGLEPWVFQARTPDELCGRHAELMGAALAADEALHYLLYSPVFDAECGLFGIHGTPASHGVAITQDRFVITRDPHGTDAGPTVESIPFPHVLSVDLGGALVLGWLAIHFVPAEPEDVRSVVVLFGSSGLHHFEALVRHYRWLTAHAATDDRPSIPWSDIWRTAPPYLRAATEPLLLQEEHVSAVLHWGESWRSAKQRWKTAPICATTPGLLCLSRVGLLWVASEPRLRPDVLSFGVNATAIPWDAMHEVTLERGQADGAAARLRLRLGRGRRSAWAEMAMDQQGADCARQLLARLQERP